MLRNTIGAVAALTVGIEAAQACDQASKVMTAVPKGVYYSLTPEAAQDMKISVQKLVELAELQNTQSLAFQVKEDGELDLSVYENGVFTQIRSDIVKRAQE